MKITSEEKLSELQELVKQREEIERKIEAILEPEPIIAPPPGFNLTKEIVKVIQQKPGGITTDDIFASIQKTWRHLNITRPKVNSTLVYLKSKVGAVIESVEGSRGTYRIKREEEKKTE